METYKIREEIQEAVQAERTQIEWHIRHTPVPENLTTQEERLFIKFRDVIASAFNPIVRERRS